MTPTPEHTSPRSGFRYVASYWHDGKQFTVDLWAKNQHDADRHVAAIRHSLALDGQVYMREDMEGGLQ